MNQSLRTCLARLTVLSASLALGGWALSARADLYFTDGDFGAQTLGNAVGAPWAPVGSGNTVTAEAQSPYENVYPSNGKGAHFPASSGNPYIVRGFADKAIPATATDPAYFNLDFRNLSTEPGDYSIVITRDASGAARSVAFYVTGDTLYAESGGEGGVTCEPILTLQPDTWYNLQVTLDLAAKTYSGTVVSRTESATISSRPFIQATEPINCVYTDGGTSYIPGAAPTHDLDNWALSTTPLAPLGAGACVISTAPSGSAVSPDAVIMVELQDNVTQVVTNSIQLLLNDQAVVPSITKPAGGDVTTVTYDPPGAMRPSPYTVRIIFEDTAKPPVVTTNEFGFVVPGPQVTSTAPRGEGYKPDAVIQITVTDINTELAQDTIQLLLNGQTVAPTISKPAGSVVTTITYAPAGGLTPDSTNTVRLIFGDTSVPPVWSTNEFGFAVCDPVTAAAIVNIDFKGLRNIPGPDAQGPTYEGVGAAGGGRIFNAIIADSLLEDGTDEDNLTIEGSALLNSIGQPTVIGFTVSPVGGDVGGAPTTNPTAPEALWSDYFFNNSAGNTAGESPFALTGLGAGPYVDLYVYRTGGAMTITGSPRSDFAGRGIFTAGNTHYYRLVPVVDGSVSGTFGSGTAVIEGMTIVTLLPQPFVLSASPTGGGVKDTTPIRLELQDYVTEVNRASVQLFLNGQAVVPAIDKPAGSKVTTVTYTPPAPWAQGSTNMVRIVFGDTAQPPVVQTYDFSFAVLSEARAALIVNIDFDGARNIPGPRGPGPTFVGVGPVGGGAVWNGILADSRLEDGTDDDNLTVGGTGLLDSLGKATGIAFTVSPVGGDDAEAPPGTEATAAAALLGDYVFVGSAAQITGSADFTLTGFGTNQTADLYFFRVIGAITIPGATPVAFAGSGIFTPNNTVYFKQVPITGGSITGSFTGLPGVFYGLSVDLNPPAVEPPGSLTVSLIPEGVKVTWTGGGLLQTADAITGQWTTVPGATSPKVFPVSGSQQFYRLRQ